MKRLTAILLFCLMLAAVPAVAEELYTFAGVPWDTPISECETVLKEKIGVEFHRYLGEDYDQNSPSFNIEEGYYSVLGMPVEPNGGNSVIAARCLLSDAYYNGTAEWEDDAAWTLGEIICRSPMLPLKDDPATAEADSSGLNISRSVYQNFVNMYGEPSYAYVTGYGEELNQKFYIVPEAELPYIFADSLAFADHHNWYYGSICVVCSNVEFTVDLGRSTQSGRDNSWSAGYCRITLRYFDPRREEPTLGDSVFEEGIPFPWVNGEPDYVVIDP